MSREPVPTNSIKMNALVGIAALGYEAPHKKPWLAALMSALVPGTGKMYSGYWGDGIISLLFTASSSFFTYRAFNKYGPDKVYPWIAGGLAVSYYAGNIYGGHKAAVRHNNNIEHGFIHQTEQVLFTGY
jgi:TM2 domain-containing membrane protein YozV